MKTRLPWAWCLSTLCQSKSREGKEIPIHYTENQETGVVELVLRGSLTLADYVNVMSPMAELAERLGKIKVVEVVESFASFDETQMTDEAESPDASNLLSRVSHAAIVSDIGWFCPILNAAPSGLGIQVKAFKLRQRDCARAWAARSGGPKPYPSKTPEAGPQSVSGNP